MLLRHSRDVLVHDGVVVTHDAEPGPLLGVTPVLQGLPHHRGAAGGGAVTCHTGAQSGALKTNHENIKISSPFFFGPASGQINPS